MRPGCAALLAFTLTTAAMADTGTVHGEVRNIANQALPDASLHLEGTDLHFPLKGARDYSLELPPGQHVLVASGFGYRMMRRYVTIEAGQVTQVDFMMTSVVHSPFRGAVRDGLTHAGFRATFRVLGTPLAPRQTHETGMFAGFLPRGEYQVEFSAPGYYREVTTLVVPNQELIVRLKPQPAAALAELGAEALEGRSPRQVTRLLLRRWRFRP
jgi:hypothetical protein